MKCDRQFDRWRRRYQQLLKRQALLLRRSRRRGDAGAIHDLRVTIRRLRLMTRLAIPFIGRASADAYRAWSRKVSDATSAIRDHDVALEWLATQAGSAPLIQSLSTRRLRLWRVNRSRLQLPTVAQCRRLARFRVEAKARRRFTRRYAKRFARLLDRIRPALARYDRMTLDERHAFRRQLRQLRYLRDCALPKDQQSSDPLLRLILGAQVAMGEVQNLQLVENFLGASSEDPADPVLRKRLADRIGTLQLAIQRSLKRLAARLVSHPTAPA